MKTKIKFYSLAIMLLFLSVFFVGASDVKAETYAQCYSGCIESGSGDGTECQSGCSYLLDSDGNPTLNVSDMNMDGAYNTDCSDYANTYASSGLCQCYDGYVRANDGSCYAGAGDSCSNNYETEACCVANTGYWYNNKCNTSPATDFGPGDNMDNFKTTNPVDKNGNSSDTCDPSPSCWFYNCCGKSNTQTSTPTQTPAQLEATKKAAQETKVDALAAISKAQRAYSTAEAAKQKVATDCASGSVILCEAAKDAAKKAEDDLAKAIDDSLAAANAANRAASIANPSTATTGAGFSLCANGILATICQGGGGTPYVAGISTGNYGGGSSGGFGSYGGGTGMVNSPKCETGFTDIGGVCFPGNTGLSNAPIYVIVSNIFSWLMGLFTTLAVVAFVVSGIQYFMASGDEHMAESAKDNAKNASIGILVGLSGFIIIKAIAAALSGTSYFF